MQNQRKKRIKYTMALVLLFMIEIFIALHVHDAIIRPYVGDTLVVILIYCAISIIIPNGLKNLPLWVFLFSAGIECLQYFHLIQVLGLQEHKILSIVLGSTFDLKDIGCYGLGGILLGIYQFLERKGSDAGQQIN